MTKIVCSRSIFSVLIFFTLVHVSQSQQQDGKLVELWSNRVVETTTRVASNPKTKDYDLDYHLDLAALALGQNGRVEEALKLLDRTGLSKDARKRQSALMSLADGLSTSDFVEAALAESSKIENENLRATSFSLVAIRQSQRGDFDDAVKLLERIPNSKDRDRAIAQICEELGKVNKIEDAQKLCSSIADQNVRTDVSAKIAKRKATPSVLDADYVKTKLNDAKEIAFVTASEDELEFLRHFHQAEVAHASKDTQRFDVETQAAQKVALAMTQNDGALLRLAGLMFQAKRLDAAKSLYVKLFENYMARNDDQPAAFDFNQMLFGSGRESDAWIVANCMTDVELKAVIEKLLKRECTVIVAAPIFGWVVQRSNPSWAEDLYRNASVKLQAELAVNCLFAFAQKQ